MVAQFPTSLMHLIGTLQPPLEVYVTSYKAIRRIQKSGGIDGTKRPFLFLFLFPFLYRRLYCFTDGGLGKMAQGGLVRALRCRSEGFLKPIPRRKAVRERAPR